MKKLIIPALILVMGIGSGVYPTFAEDEPKEVPKQKDEKPSIGDRDDVALQYKRNLKVRNATDEMVTVFLQFRAVEAGAWSWIPGDPTKTNDAVSFEIEAGKELDLQYKDAPLGASRVRIWATSPKMKWLQYKSKDMWVVPEKTEDGEHVYSASSVETYTFSFSNAKDKGVIPGDSDMPGEQCLPTDGENLPPVPPIIIWDEIPNPLPPDFALIRDLAVLPVYTSGLNATIRVKNLGHFSANGGRRLMVQKIAPGSMPVDKGPIGPLYHYSVKTFYLLGMAPGNYIAFVSPGDDVPFGGNDKRGFTITAAAYSDAAILPVSFAGGKTHIKVKNLGTAAADGMQHLITVKLPAGVPVDHGAIGVLNPNQIKAFPGMALAAGNYKAYLSPGDSPPNHFNDDRLFNVAVATYVDLDVLPIVVAAGKATIKIKNIGTEDAPAGAHLKTQKLPGGVIVDRGPIGAVNVNAVKIFANIPLAPGNYKAFITPGDPVPYHGNDSENFAVNANADLEALAPTKVGGMVKATIKNNGPDPYPSGVRSWHLEKFVLGSWQAIPTVGSHVIPNIGNGSDHTVQGTFTGNGNYRIRITAGDLQPANDTKSKILP